MKFTVYIRQINQCCYPVKANTREEAVSKAKIQWRRENYPDVLSVEAETTEKPAKEQA